MNYFLNKLNPNPTEVILELPANLCDSPSDLKVRVRMLLLLVTGQDSFLWVQVHDCLLAETRPNVRDQRLGAKEACVREINWSKSTIDKRKLESFTSDVGRSVRALP